MKVSKIVVIITLSLVLGGFIDNVDSNVMKKQVRYLFLGQSTAFKTIQYPSHPNKTEVVKFYTNLSSYIVISCSGKFTCDDSAYVQVIGKDKQILGRYFSHGEKVVSLPHMSRAFSLKLMMRVGSNYTSSLRCVVRGMIS